MTADELIERFKLEPHPKEGGFFRETYRSSEQLDRGALAVRYQGPRAVSTAIYYLLTPDSRSMLHRLQSDEVFHFYLGDPVEMLQLYPDGSGRIRLLGAYIESGMAPQMVVPASVWQGARLRRGGEFALLGTTVAPGFDYADYETGRAEDLVAAHPQFEEMIRDLC